MLLKMDWYVLASLLFGLLNQSVYIKINIEILLLNCLVWLLQLCVMVFMIW